MKTVSQAIDVFMAFQRVNAGKKTIKNYQLFLDKFNAKSSRSNTIVYIMPSPMV